MNIPVAIVALILIAWSKPVSAHQPARLDYRGAVLIAAGIALSVLGFQQSQVWGWTNPATPTPRTDQANAPVRSTCAPSACIALAV